MTTPRSYYRIILGRKNVHAEPCHEQSFIGGDWGLNFDLADSLESSVEKFRETNRPIYRQQNPDKSKVSAGLATGMLYTICKGIAVGDIVLCPTGDGACYVGEVNTEYQYVPGGMLPHRRGVQWYPHTLAREEVSLGLKNSAGSIGTVSNISKHHEEIDGLLEGISPQKLFATDETIEDPTVFALEKHLEDFLVSNWASTEMGNDYDIYTEDGEVIGQQYPSDTGPIDILAISKDKKELLVVELKKGRASDAVVGQVQRYMGYVKADLCETGQAVRGVIVALEDDLRIKRALQVTSNIDFYRYQVSFKLFKV